MTRVLFYRHGSVVRLLEILGVMNSLLFLKRGFTYFDGPMILYLFLFSTYLFVRICTWIRWYEEEGELGIRVHFQKALVPTSYILAINSTVCFFLNSSLSIVLLSFSLLLMLAVTSVNGILIYFHRQDQDPLPINGFSRNLYLLKGDRDASFPIQEKQPISSV